MLKAYLASVVTLTLGLSAVPITFAQTAYPT